MLDDVFNYWHPQQTPTTNTHNKHPQQTPTTNTHNKHPQQTCSLGSLLPSNSRHYWERFHFPHDCWERLNTILHHPHYDCISSAYCASWYLHLSLLYWWLELFRSSVVVLSDHFNKNTVFVTCVLHYLYSTSRMIQIFLKF